MVGPFQRLYRWLYLLDYEDAIKGKPASVTIGELRKNGAAARQRLFSKADSPPAPNSV